MGRVSNGGVSRLEEARFMSRGGVFFFGVLWRGVIVVFVRREYIAVSWTGRDFFARCCTYHSTPPMQGRHKEYKSGGAVLSKRRLIFIVPSQ